MIYYCLYDKSLKLFNPPFVESSDERAKIAVRNFLLSSDDVVFKKLKNDILLARVARFNEVDGVFENDLKFIYSLSDIPLPNNSFDEVAPGGDQCEKIS